MENISVFDCEEGDHPIELTPDNGSFRPAGSSSCAAIGIIDRASDPTAIVSGSDAKEKLHTACSALHFEPVANDVEWRIVFHITQFNKGTFPII